MNSLIESTNLNSMAAASDTISRSLGLNDTIGFEKSQGSEVNVLNVVSR